MIREKKTVLDMFSLRLFFFLWHRVLSVFHASLLVYIAFTIEVEK